MTLHRAGPRVVLIDDDDEVLEAYAQTLQLGGFEVEACASLIEARPHVRKDMATVVLTDVKMPARDGFAVLQMVQDIDAEIPVVR